MKATPDRFLEEEGILEEWETEPIELLKKRNRKEDAEISKINRDEEAEELSEKTLGEFLEKNKWVFADAPKFVRFILKMKQEKYLKEKCKGKDREKAREVKKFLIENGMRGKK